MTQAFTYRVLRQMDGDRQYFEGDERELLEHEAQHLVDLGVLEKLGPVQAKAAPLNKAEEPPANKARHAQQRKVADK